MPDKKLIEEAKEFLCRELQVDIHGDGWNSDELLTYAEVARVMVAFYEAMKKAEKENES